MYKCSFPGCPVPVSIHISLIETLQGIVHSESGNRQGILHGQPSAVGAVAESSQALPVFGMEEMRRAIAEAHQPVVGFYRIREGNSLELTPDEVDIGVTLFARPGSVILLIERRATGPEANFFFLEHGAYLNLPLLEFPLDVARLTEREAQRVRRNVGEEAVRAAAELPPPASGPGSPPTAANGVPAPARGAAIRLWMVAIVILVAIAASFSAAFFIYRPHNRVVSAGAAVSTPSDSRTSLRAERQGEDLKIIWDLNSPEVAGATSGVLDIDDGGMTRRIPMTADQVRFGSLLYTPVSEQVSVRLTALKDNQTTKQESVLVLLRRPAQAQAKSGQPSPRIPFEVKSVKPERTPATRAFVPPAGDRGVKPSVELEEPPAIQASTQRVDLPTPPLGSVSPPPALAISRSEPAKPAPQANPQHVDSPAPSQGSVAPPPGITVPRTEPVKPATQASPQRVDPPASALGSASSPAAGALPPSEPAKPAAQTPLVSASPRPPIAAPQTETAKPAEEGYVAPVLTSQAGVRVPRELQPILTRPVAVSVRVDVNEAGRVTRAEAIAEKGIHALLLNAAADAARQCRFQPARRGQSAVSSTVTIVFHIDPAK
jgi:TonB family protein